MSMTVTIQIEGNNLFMFGSDLELATATTEEKKVINELKNFLNSRSVASNCNSYDDDDDYNDYDEEDYDEEDYDEEDYDEEDYDEEDYDEEDYDEEDYDEKRKDEDYYKGYRNGFSAAKRCEEADYTVPEIIKYAESYSIGYYDGYVDGVL